MMNPDTNKFEPLIEVPVNPVKEENQPSRLMKGMVVDIEGQNYKVIRARPDGRIVIKRVK